MLRKTILLVSMVLVPSLSIAAGNSTWGHINELYFGSAGNYVRVTMDVSDSQGFCGMGNKPYILYLDQSNDVTKEFYKTRISILMMAFAANKKIQFWLHDGECSPQKEPKVFGVNVKY